MRNNAQVRGRLCPGELQTRLNSVRLSAADGGPVQPTRLNLDHATNYRKVAMQASAVTKHKGVTDLPIVRVIRPMSCASSDLRAVRCGTAESSCCLVIIEASRTGSPRCTKIVLGVACVRRSVRLRRWKWA